ncbi:MAG: endolytic transglycosylase MltG [Bacteroidota bacterium]|jgi:UPF0755 protein
MIKNFTISWRYTSLIIGLLLVFAAYKFAADLLLNNVKDANKKASYVYIKSNQSFDRLMFNLKKDEILKNPESFERVAKLLDISDKIKPGRYKIEYGLSNLDIIKILKSGSQEPLNLVVKYAKRKENLALALSKQLELDSASLLNIINDSNTLKKAKMDENNIISLFVPNTYNIYWNITGQKLIERMIKEYNTFWNVNRTTKSILMKLSLQQVATLASIVMSETNKIDEMPIVARVYLNRIEKGMALQADPTVLFALNDSTIKRVLSIHLAFNSPYNTYLNSGLPPGPICMASPEAIDAVLNAPLHNYLYFCAKDDLSGYHNFAETFAQHQLNARKYQQELNRRGY